MRKVIKFLRVTADIFCLLVAAMVGGAFTVLFGYVGTQYLINEAAPISVLMGVLGLTCAAVLAFLMFFGSNGIIAILRSIRQTLAA